MRVKNRVEVERKAEERGRLRRGRDREREMKREAQEVAQRWSVTSLIRDAGVDTRPYFWLV